jgi:heme-degrading monooxygenase HmoA
MLLEIITLAVQSSRTQAFEHAFYGGQSSLLPVPGYCAHELQRSLDEPGHYLLLIEWHERPARPAHLATPWWQDLQAFFAEAPASQHYRAVAGRGIGPRPLAGFVD